ncbi:hypothetical protein KC669_00890 [Candidatus Dojkabacteria bacterium]|uniref:Uncharacterized protein n=1 Tax=Candidatus Dojkabacteria bacterium TaxID=2099670 RepID=A0A955L9F1_9BACT|nr:hypothetical protein [Candidatus Dojkabacteria bacterium]
MSDEVKSEITDVSESSKPMSSFIQNKNTVRALIVGAGIVFLLVIFIFLLFTNYGKSKSFNVTSGVEEAGVYIEESFGLTLDAMDFRTFNPEQPLDFIDFEKLEKEMNNLSEKFTFWESPESSDSIDLKGKTVNSILDSNADITLEDDTVGLKMNLDIQTQYSENYETDKFELDSAQEMIEFFSNNSDEEIQELLNEMNIFVDGTFTISSIKNGNLDVDTTVALINGQGYFVLNDIENGGLITPEDMASIESIVGKTLGIDPKDGIKQIFGFYAEALKEAGSVTSYDSLAEFKNSQEYKDLNQELAQNFAGMPEEQIELIQNTGPKVVNIIKDNLKNLDMFVNIAEIDPFSENTNSICYSGDLNSKGIVETTQNVFLDSYDVIVEDLSDIYGKSDTFKDMVPEQDKVAQNREDMMEAFESVSAFAGLVKFNLTSCHDKDNKFNTGKGINFDIEVFGYGIEGYLNSYTKTFESEFEMPTLEVEVDYTNEFTELFSNLSSVYEDALLPIESPSTLDYDDYEDSFDTTLSGPEQELTDRYINGEITYEEYVDALNELYGL